MISGWERNGEIRGYLLIDQYTVVLQISLLSSKTLTYGTWGGVTFEEWVGELKESVALKPTIECWVAKSCQERVTSRKKHDYC